MSHGPSSAAEGSVTDRRMDLRIEPSVDEVAAGIAGRLRESDTSELGADRDDTDLGPTASPHTDQ